MSPIEEKLNSLLILSVSISLTKLYRKVSRLRNLCAYFRLSLNSCEMSLFHAEFLLQRLHDQYVRGLDCDLILIAADHCGETNPKESCDKSSGQVWVKFPCHKNVIRATSSFFDRIFETKFTYEESRINDGISGMLIKNEADERVILQITLHEISSHSMRAFINFAYTGCVEVENNVLKRVIGDLKMMNLLSMINKLESRLGQDTTHLNCLANLVISFCLEKPEMYRSIVAFILKEFFRGMEGTYNEKTWNPVLQSDLSLPEMNSKVVEEIKNETADIMNRGIDQEQCLVGILLELMEKQCISVDQETKLIY